MDKNGSKVNKSVAPGQANGYYLQTYYAFFELVKVKGQETIVCIEKNDDISNERIAENELIQLKSSGSTGNNPVSDCSAEFWKAIYNWCIYSQDKTSKYKYVVITKKPLNIGLTLGFIDRSNSKDEAEKAYEIMLKTLYSSENKDDAFLKHKKYLCDLKNKEKIVSIFVNLVIEVIDSSFCAKINEAFQNKCLYSPHYQEIKTYMLGWVDEAILKAIDNEKPIEIKTADFNKVLLGQVNKYSGSSLTINETYDEKEVKTTISKDPVFIRQLTIIGIDEQEKYDAAINYLIEERNVSEWIKDLDVLPVDYRDYKKSIIDEYKCIRNGILDDPLDKIIIGKKIFHKTNEECPQRVKLKGAEVQHTIVRGTIQALSNDLEIGWHPDYKTLIEKQSDGEEDDR